VFNVHHTTTTNNNNNKLNKHNLITVLRFLLLCIFRILITMENKNTGEWEGQQVEPRRVDRYDGQSIFIQSEVAYTTGGYLGSGASGTVMQATSSGKSPARNEKDGYVAIKFLRPLGYKFMPSGQLQKCVLVQKEPVPPTAEQISGKLQMTVHNVGWVYHTETKQFIAAYHVR